MSLTIICPRCGLSNTFLTGPGASFRLHSLCESCGDKEAETVGGAEPNGTAADYYGSPGINAGIVIPQRKFIDGGKVAYPVSWLGIV